MPITMNHAAYVELLDGDLEWLRKQPRTLEREHVILCIEAMKERAHYDIEAAKAAGRRSHG